MNGILSIWKERGMTSHDVVFQLRKILRTKKIGHTGTLDPEVDGVLPVCIGPATKAAEFLTEKTKQYQGSITLGISTTTEDAYGEIVERKTVQPDEIMPGQVDAAMKKMLGPQIQIPPMYSAVKVNGKKLYEYARRGEQVDRPERKIEIHRFERTSPLYYDAEQQTLSWRFEVLCGKGTYVRTLAVDLGQRLGYPAHMSDLTRTTSGSFDRHNSLTLEEVRRAVENGTIADALFPVETVFEGLPAFELDDLLMSKVQNGAVLEREMVPDIAGDFMVFTYQQKIVALYENHPQRKGYIKPRKMFLSN